MLRNVLPVFLAAIVVFVCACDNTSLPSYITKPTINVVPENWFLEEDIRYGKIEGDSDDTKWGLIHYTDEIDQDLVRIYYGDVPSELKGHENDEDALIEWVTLEASKYFVRDETGSMTIAGNIAGYAKGYDLETDTYSLDIVSINDTTCLDIYASFDATDDDEAQVMSLIKSISMD